MTYRAIALTAATTLFFALTAACTNTTTESESAPSAPTADSTTDEGESSDLAQGTLETYDGPAYSFPIRAQYPDTMQVDGGCSGEGCGFFFTFVPQGNALDTAEVHVFLPRGAATAADQEPFVTGPNGLIENAGWTVDSVEADGSERFPYGWVETVINFSTDQEESGHILLGQAEGQAIQVLLKYPAEMADAYWSGADVVLESLEFEPDLLPLEPSSEGGIPGEDPGTMCNPDNESC